MRFVHASTSKTPGFALRALGCAVVVLTCSLAAPALHAQDTAPSPAAAPMSSLAAPSVTPARSGANKPATPTAGWSRLSAAQKLALSPLAATWDSLNSAHQRKWLEVSKNFASLPAPEQGKMHARMSEWAALSPQERAQARLNFGKTAEIARELSPEEKLAKWQAYQALSPEERQKLAEGAKTRPLGAAPAVKPVPPQKLAVVPPQATAKASRPTEPAAAETAPSN